MPEYLSRVTVLRMSDHAVTVLSRALDQAHVVLSAVREDQLGDPTPCADWNVATLIGHLASGPGNFLISQRGEQPDWSADPAPATGGFAEQFRADADALLSEWEKQDDTGGAIWQTTEFAVHTWDVANATGYPVDQLDDEVAEQALGFMSGALKDDQRGDAFAARQDVPEGAPAYDRLAGFAGRSPA